MKTTLAAALAASVLALAGCAFPQQASTQPPARATTHAVAPRMTPVPPFAALIGIIQNCAAGADFPGQSRRTRIRDFATCLGIQDVPVADAACAEQQFRLHEAQGAEAVALAVRTQCKATTNREETIR